MEKLMKCGHSANGYVNGKPCCVICVPKKEAFEEADEPNLEGRYAKCSLCDNIKISNLILPFFEYCPDKEYDSYYCGCRGWN